MQRRLLAVAAALVASVVAAMALVAPADAGRPKADDIDLAGVVQLPYENARLLDLEDPARPVDAAGVQHYERKGERFFHPVGMAQYGLAALDGYERTGDPEYLRRAKANGRKLLEVAVEHDGALFFPYPFDFPLGGSKINIIEAPWYSAMAQGQVLSLLVRLWEHDLDPSWRAAADKVLPSFSVPRSDGDPWVSFVDDNGYLWFEEYAGDTAPLKVFNGHVFAMYGLYDYYRMTASPKAEELFAAGASTIAGYIDEFRVPGELSFYCVHWPVCRAKRWQDVKYHKIHTAQLAMLADMTDSEWFRDMAEKFREDFA